MQPLAYTQETNGTAFSGSVSGPQSPHGTISSQIPAGVTRNVTSEVMPLAEAVTQLSHSLSSYSAAAPPLPPQLPVPNSPLNAAVQTLPHSTLSQDASTQMGARPASSFSIDVTVQTLVRNIVSPDTSTQPLTEFFIGCIFSYDPLDREGSSSVQCDAGSASPPQPPDIATNCNPSSSSLARDGHVHTCLTAATTGSRRGMPTCAPLMAYLLKRHRCDLVCVQLSQSRPHSHMSVPPMWEHILCAQLQPTREV